MNDEQHKHALLAAVADPIRLRILSFIRTPRAVRDICDHLGMAQPRISHHLAILRSSGLVKALSTGRMRLYHWAQPSGNPEIADIQGLLRRWLEIKEDPAISATGEEPVPPRKIMKAMQAHGKDRPEKEKTQAPGSPAQAPKTASDMEDYLL